jgi:hypothetical protein
MAINTNQVKISNAHMDVLKEDLDLKDDRAIKEIISFLIVFGEPLYKNLQKKTQDQNSDSLKQYWNIACEIGGVISEKLKTFGCGGFESNNLTWNYLVFKYKERVIKSYMNLVDSLLVAYGI